MDDNNLKQAGELLAAVNYECDEHGVSAELLLKASIAISLHEIRRNLDNISGAADHVATALMNKQ